VHYFDGSSIGPAAAIHLAVWGQHQHKLYIAAPDATCIALCVEIVKNVLGEVRGRVRLDERRGDRKMDVWMEAVCMKRKEIWHGWGRSVE